MKRWVLIISFLLVTSAFAHAFEVRAFVDRTQTIPSESIHLTVTINGGEGNVDVSGIQDFKVVSTGTGSSMQIVNGRVSREFSCNYTLIPLKEGRLKIPPLEIDSGGKTYRTREIIIQVLKESQKNAGNRNIFVEARVSDPNPFVGQQITYNFKLYNAVRITNANLQKPAFSGFSAKELEDRQSYKTVISGQEFMVTDLKIVLVPLNARKMIIEPAVLECDVVQHRKRQRSSAFDSFFDDPFFGRTELESKIFRTDPLQVDVKPLPTDTEKLKFSGLVGSFEIKAALEGSQMKVGDSMTLAITIQGNGNIMDAQAPDIEIPAAFKVYMDTPEEEINVDENGYSGKKVFRLALVAIEAGQYVIPSIQLRYFNVSKSSYETYSTLPISLLVNPSSEADKLNVFSTPQANESAPVLKKKVEFIGRDILPLKEELDALKSHGVLSFYQFVFWLLIPAFFCLLAKAVLVLSRKNDSPEKMMAEKALKALKKASHINATGPEFLSCLYRSVVAAIFSTAGTKGESLTYIEAEEILTKRGYSAEVAEQAAELLRKIESAKYSGSNSDTPLRENLLSETKKLVRSLSK
ncbi:MAG: protein BatD [Desulfobacterales bacterium]|nr:protein BatD [Desulfobacterales bacterium]